MIFPGNILSFLTKIKLSLKLNGKCLTVRNTLAGVGLLHSVCLAEFRYHHVYKIALECVQ